jgi:hypothetical protein
MRVSSYSEAGAVEQKDTMWLIQEQGARGTWTSGPRWVVRASHGTAGSGLGPATGPKAKTDFLVAKIDNSYGLGGSNAL